MEKIKTFKFVKDTIDYVAGETIFDKGDRADYMYVVRSGSVEIVLNDKVIEVVEEDGVFGEMALIDASRRSAMARAKTDCELIKVNEKMFLDEVHTIPFFSLQVMRVLVKRLRNLMELQQ